MRNMLLSSKMVILLLSMLLALCNYDAVCYNGNGKLGLNVDAAGLQYQLTDKQKVGILKMFNLARKKARPQGSDLPALVWDDNLAKYASDYVQQCDLWNQYPRWGDAMIMYRDRGLDPVDIAHYRSVRQGPWFDYYTGQCRIGTENKCAHPEIYARIVNNKVRRVGCEIYPCEVEKRYHHVCVMDYMGELQPGDYWTIGSACSDCPIDLPHCNSGLCSHSQVTSKPTTHPNSNVPTKKPTTPKPTKVPVPGKPTKTPLTVRPTSVPVTKSPTVPTMSPTSKPTKVPTTKKPTTTPTTRKPTPTPTAKPTRSPAIPTMSPTKKSGSG